MTNNDTQWNGQPVVSRFVAAPSAVPLIRRVAMWLEREPTVGIAVALAIVPWIIPQKTLAIDLLIFTLVAASFNLLIGYAGVLSLGHSTFFGIGAYAGGVLLAKAGIVNLWAALLIGMVVPALFAIPIGWFCLRRRLLYFTMLTLAFNQMLYFVALQARPVTGGEDGLRGIPIPPLDLPGITIPLDSIAHPFNFYYFALIVVVLCLLFIQRLVQSPFGRSLEAIRESEVRALSVGYDTNRLQLIVFVMAGCLAGLAGALQMLTHSFAGLDSMSWIVNIGVIIITVLGGKGTLVGPVVGAAIYLLLQEYVSRMTRSWQLVLGLVFVVLVVFLPQGVWGSFKVWSRNREKARARNFAQPSLGDDVSGK